LVAEEQVVGPQPEGVDVGHDLGAELEPAVLLVLRVVLDQETTSRWMLLAGDADDGAADGEGCG
jgi:hypothetical protein